MTVWSIDRLLLGQIDNDPSNESSYFQDSKAEQIVIIDEDETSNRFETSQRIEVYNLLGPTDDIAKDFDEPSGVYQISLFTERNSGKGKAFRLAQELKVRYPRIVSGTPNLNVTQVGFNSPIPEGQFYRVELSVNYFYFEKVEIS